VLLPLQTRIVSEVCAPVITGSVIAAKQLVGRVPLFNLVLPAGFSVPISVKHGFELSIRKQ